MEATTIGAVPLIIGIVELAKRLGLPVKYASLFAVILGVAAAFLLESGAIAQKALTGIVYGLSAAGLYSSAKTVIKPKVTD